MRRQVQTHAQALAPAQLTPNPAADHFFLDSFVPFFSTAIQTGILKLDAFWHRSGPAAVTLAC